MATSWALEGKPPLTGLKDSKRAGTVEATKPGAPPVVRRLPCVSRNVPGEKMAPDASATPGVARTFASSSSVIGDVCERTRRPRVCVGVTTTSWPLLAVWKMAAKEWLMVSVRT